MAFPTTSRSFTNLSTGPFSDANRNGNSGAFTSSLGNGVGFNGQGSIWSVGNGTSSRDPTRDNSRSRDYDQLRASKQKEADGRSGSRDLLRGSQSSTTGWPYAKQDATDRPPPVPRFSEQTRTQSWNLDTGNLQQSVPSDDKISPTSVVRPPTVNITSQSFHNPQTNGSNTVYGNKAPTVYTKPKPPQSIDTPHTVSPIEPRPGQWSFIPPSSSNSSQPPSRHSNREPPWPDFNSRGTSANTRNQSFSSQRNPSYSSFHSGHDQVLPQFGQLSLNQNGHAAAMRKASEATNIYMPQKPAVDMSSFRLPSFRGHADMDLNDDIEEIQRSQMDYQDLGSYASNQSNDFPRFQNPGRFAQTPAPFECRPGQAFSNGQVSPREYEGSNGGRMNNDWPTYNSGQLARQSSGLQDQQSILDPRIQHMMAMRSPYDEALFNPYVAMQMGPGSPYYPMFPVGLPGLDSGMPLRDSLVSDGVQSTKLYEFKNVGKNNKRYELKDIFDHIAEFAGDQHGSRFIQTKLETANSDEKERVFREIEPNAIPLMTDVFGNYVIQKFFDHGHQDHKKMLANKMRGQVLNLSMQMYGCRVVQKALEHVLVEQQAALVGELENHVLQCVKDQNGNHVIQKAIERCASDTIGFIYQAFLGQVQHLSLHPYGCRVIQRCLERQEWFPTKPRILAELHDSMPQGMIADQYGNYVVQHVIEKGGIMDKKHVFAIVLQGVEGYSKHKFASNVVEKCIEYSDDAWRRDVINVLILNDQRIQDEQRRGGLGGERESVLVGLIKDQFGNYVIQKLLDKLAAPDYILFHQHLQPAISHAKRTGGGKQLIAIEKKMHRFPIYPHGHGYPLGLPPTPFASNYGSVANTPPPLTADTRSVQSSGIPSVNGDTVDGATSKSRKGSEPSDDGTLMR